MNYTYKEILDYSKGKIELNLTPQELNEYFRNILYTTLITNEEKKVILSKNSIFTQELKKVIDIKNFNIAYYLTEEIVDTILDTFKQEIDVQEIYNSLTLYLPTYYSDDIIKTLIKKGANPNEYDLHKILIFSETQLKFLLNNEFNKLSFKNFIKFLLKDNTTFNSQNTKIDKTQLSNIIQDLVKNHKLDINDIIKDLDQLEPGIFATTQEDIIEILLQYGNLDPNVYAHIILKHSKDIDLESFKSKFDLALKHGADINHKYQSEEENYKVTHLEISIDRLNFDVIDYLLTKPGIKTNSINFEVFLEGLQECSTIYEVSELISRFPNTFDKEKFIELAHIYGATDILINKILDVYDLAFELYKAKQFNDWSKFNKVERSILDLNYKCFDPTEYIHAKCKNKQGFKPIHLAALAGDYRLITTLIEEGIDPLQTTENGLTILHYIDNYDHNKSDKEKSDKNKLFNTIFNNISDIDVELSEGETIVDHLIKNEDVKDKVLEKTNDPLFMLLKDDIDSSDSIMNDYNTHIAITHGAGFFSSDVWSVARLMKKEHKDIQFHLVTHDVMLNKTANFYNQFDGWINPGGGDTYPSHPFTKEDYEPKLDMEKAYKVALEKTEKYSIPSIGMCAGAQQLSLYHNGTIHKVEGYNGGNHTAEFIPGTIAHFLLLNLDQKNEAISDCHLPKIDFKISTAHQFAAVPGSIGNNMELAAVSEEGVPMSYCQVDGMRCATQFHPERFYNANNTEQNYNYQKNWLDSFIQITRYNKMLKSNPDKADLKTYFSNVSDILQNCINDDLKSNLVTVDYTNIQQTTEEIFGS